MPADLEKVLDKAKKLELHNDLCEDGVEVRLLNMVRIAMDVKYSNKHSLNIKWQCIKGFMEAKLALKYSNGSEWFDIK